MMKNDKTDKTSMRELQWAIRHFCFGCSMKDWKDVALCDRKVCPLYNLRPTVGFGRIDEMGEAMRKFCKECTGDAIGGVRGCPSKACQLYAFRLYKQAKG